MTRPEEVQGRRARTSSGTIEKNTLPGSPLWSAVLAAAGTGESLRLHREVSHLLQREVPAEDSNLVTQLTADCAQLRRQ
ncbi:hypothetical protein [Streptomyces sp. KCTC 0041BP]|uniref:hypothetical protein n=1 Tax=Streptomyces sp. KCTC 0041BP TaxID=201500 RepID=UPI001AE90078|nr:hypothetical protein [Streptomyces sp. KCTC 0041BP]MBP0932611.1 hypothetical protein [Streptomyces sp. KCTC 0041BP]